MRSIPPLLRKLCAAVGLFVALGLDVSPAPAAEPLPSLDELLKLYTDLGLPLPPKDAKLVRYGIVGKASSSLAVQIKPAAAPEGPVLLMGADDVRCGPEWHTKEISPEPSAVDGAKIGPSHCVLAIQCHSLGWTKLAQRLLELSQKDAKDPLKKTLVRDAWYHWQGQVTKPKIDRIPVARRLNQIIQLDKELDTKENRALLRSLELALVPSKAKPGSVEALIDDLVDLHRDEISLEGPDWWRPDPRSMRILERGFEAVPALIEHIDDERLTRYFDGGGVTLHTMWFLQFRVGDLVRGLLYGLAGRPATEGWESDAEGAELDKAKVRKWFEEARKVGEERYVVENVLFAFSAEAEERRAYINNSQLALIQAKYPKHLPALYRKVLDQYPRTFPIMASAVRGSKLPDKEKQELLEYGAKNREASQRSSALAALKELDKKRFNALLVAALADLPADVEPWEAGGPAELHIVYLAILSDEARVWPALEKAARKANVGFRVMLLQQLINTDEEIPNKRERVGVLARFLDDTALYDREKNEARFPFFKPSAYPSIEVGNFAALMIADLLDIKIEDDPKRTPEEWAKIRARMREAAKKRERERPM